MKKFMGLLQKHSGAVARFFFGAAGSPVIDIAQNAQPVLHQLMCLRTFQID
jgi:hypothetical protein